MSNRIVFYPIFGLNSIFFSDSLEKIAKHPKNCTGWPVEMINRKMTSNLVFDEMGFSLHNTVIMHANGPKCLRTE